MKHKPVEQSYSFTVVQQGRIDFYLTNKRWSGLERLESAKKILASNTDDWAKQNALAQLFGPASYSIVKGSLPTHEGIAQDFKSEI